MPKSNRKDKQERFVEEYLVDLNATKAAERAGYSKASARSIGHELLTKPDIQNEIAAAKAARSKRTAITQEKVLRELARIAFVDLRRAYVAGGQLKEPSDLPSDMAHAIASIEVDELFEGRGKNREPVGYTRKVRFHSKVRALEILLEHLGETDASKEEPRSFIDLVMRAREAKKKRGE